MKYTKEAKIEIIKNYKMSGKNIKCGKKLMLNISENTKIHLACGSTDM